MQLVGATVFCLFVLISSLDPNINTYIMGDFNINLLDFSTSPPVENFLDLIIFRNYYPVLPTQLVWHQSAAL